MNVRLTKFATGLFLTLAVCGAALAQNLQSNPTAQIQKLTNTATKVAIGTAAVSAGVAVIGLIVRHRHHVRSGKLNGYKAAPTQLARANPESRMASAAPSAGATATSQVKPADNNSSPILAINSSFQTQNRLSNLARDTAIPHASY